MSSFEILHSGLVKALLTYLTDDTNANVSRQCRLKSFCQEFLNIRTEGSRGYIDMLTNPPLTALLTKLNACLNQIEQFAVKVNDSPGGATGNLQGLHALKFFHSHQIKVL